MASRDDHGASRRHRDRNGDASRRDRDESRERRRHRDRRSRSPDDPSRRPRSRERDRGHRRHRDRSRDHDRDRTRRRSPEETDSRRRRRRDPSDDEDPEREGRALARHRQHNSPPMKRSGPLPSQQESFAVTTQGGGDPEKPKEKPNIGTTGRLAALSNSVAQADGSTIVLKYHEPAEARKPPPRDQWKLFVFKGKEIVDTIELSARSCWLVGRELAVVDLAAEHPSISKQHAVIQFRYTEKRNEFGDKIGRVKPYLIDLQSANGTKLNDEKVPESRYLELRDKDILMFGHSSREYVVMLAPQD